MSERKAAATHRKTVCEAAADLFEVRTSTTIAMRSAPDESERNQEAVDLMGHGRAGEPLLVLEHTSVDSFLRQRELSRWCIELLSPIEKELDGTLPSPGHYVLGVTPAESEGLKRSGATICSTLVTWIRETAPTLEVGRSLVAPRYLANLDVLKLGLNVTLCRWPHSDGRFFMRFNVPADFEEQRRARLVLALEDKCPKLAAARSAAPGSASVLVLETSDIALGNEFEIAEIVTAELLHRSDAPDHVYVIDTVRGGSTVDEWSWLVAKQGTACFPEIPEDRLGGGGPVPPREEGRQGGDQASAQACGKIDLRRRAVAGPDSRWRAVGGKRAGFWAGPWHGLISPITFFVSLFTPAVRIYETNNRGPLYDFGFLIGISATCGGTKASSG